MSAGPAAPDRVPGRVQISTRALTSCARAVTAERLGVPADRVRVSLEDHQGGIGLEITSPISDRAAIVDGAREGAVAIRERLAALSGRQVTAARIELTGIVRDPAAVARAR